MYYKLLLPKKKGAIVKVLQNSRFIIVTLRAIIFYNGSVEPTENGQLKIHKKGRLIRFYDYEITDSDAFDAAVRAEINQK